MSIGARIAIGVAVVAAFSAGAGCGGASSDAAAFRPNVRHVAVDGARLAYYERGSGPPLLMNMGSASTMGEWDPALLEKLARKHRLIIYDYRGLGLSSRIPTNGLTIAQLADDGAALLDKLGIAKADVLGWSLGGFVSQQMAVRHPDRVDHLILAATNPGGPDITLGPRWAQRIDSSPDATDAQALKTNFPLTRAGQRAGREFLRRLEVAVDRGTIPNDFHVPDNAVLAQDRAESRWYETDANLRALTKLKTPTLVADGNNDVLTPPVNSRVIARHIPGSKLVLVARSGHAFLFQFSERFARDVDRLTGAGA